MTARKGKIPVLKRGGHRYFTLALVPKGAAQHALLSHSFAQTIPSSGSPRML